MVVIKSNQKITVRQAVAKPVQKRAHVCLCVRLCVGTGAKQVGTDGN